MPSTAKAANAMPVHDLHPEPDDLLAEVREGLRSNPKTLPCKYFYDAEGSRLFDRICELDDYYPTRTEVGILKARANEIAKAIGEKPLVIELGSGSSTKTHILLDALASPAGYLPVDISREHLTQAAARIARRFPDLSVWPVCADFNQRLELPEHGLDDHPPLLFFPGSTIGNFDRPASARLLRRMRDLCGSRKQADQGRGPRGRLLIGIDLIKEKGRLESAYDDDSGVTAAFNLNLLRRINRELDANFLLENFSHRALYNSTEARIEMHLESRIDQGVEIGAERFELKAGERICTEHSHKFSIDGFGALAEQSGWILEQSWTDREKLFAVLLLRTA
jgi:L-histidine N-alpha-methyltransferase